MSRPSACFLCGLAALVLAGFFAARNLGTWPARLGYPGEESFEGVVLAEMVHFRQSIPIYAAGGAKGFDAATYGPLYYVLGSRLVSSDRPSYLRLRLLSILGTLGCAAGLGLLAFWLSRSYCAAFLSPLVFLSYGFVTWCGTSALSDSLAVFLFFSGFLVAYRFQGGRAQLFAAPLMVLGFFYKPQYVAGPVAVSLFLLLEKHYRRAAEFAGLLALCGLGLFAFFQWVAFPGQAFLRHFMFYQASLLSGARFVSVGLVLLVSLLLVPLALAAVWLYSYPDRLLTCYLAIAVLLGLVTSSKEGSLPQYFYESVLALSALVGSLLAKRMRCGELSALPPSARRGPEGPKESLENQNSLTPRRHVSKAAKQTKAFSGVCAFALWREACSFFQASSAFPPQPLREKRHRNLPLPVLVLLLGVALYMARLFTPPPPQPEDFAKHAAVQSFLRRNFPAHAPSLGSCTGDLLQAGLATPYPDLYLLSHLARRGKLSDRDLVHQIHARRFAVIVLDFDLREERDPYVLNFHLTAAIRGAIERDYEVAASVESPTAGKSGVRGRFYFYVPRSGATALRNDDRLRSRCFSLAGC